VLIKTSNNYRKKIKWFYKDNLSLKLFSIGFFLATYGVSSKEQKKIVREFLKYTYKVNVEQIQTAVMNEYIDYR
jgi:hypothetical protein